MINSNFSKLISLQEIVKNYKNWFLFEKKYIYCQNKFQLRYRNWTLVSVPNIETWLRCYPEPSLLYGIIVIGLWPDYLFKPILALCGHSLFWSYRISGDRWCVLFREYLRMMHLIFSKLLLDKLLYLCKLVWSPLFNNFHKFDGQMAPLSKFQQ